MTSQVFGQIVRLQIQSESLTENNWNIERSLHVLTGSGMEIDEFGAYALETPATGTNPNRETMSRESERLIDHHYRAGKPWRCLINFSPNYHRARGLFGMASVPFGSMGENILISPMPDVFVHNIVELSDIQGRVMYIYQGDGRTQQQLVMLSNFQVAEPCEALVKAIGPERRLKSALQDLRGGVRGFYCDVEGGATIRGGDYCRLEMP